MRVTAAVHRLINYVKQYEKCDPAARRCRLRSGEAESRFQRKTLNCEPDNLSYLRFISAYPGITMELETKKQVRPSSLQDRLSELEEQAAQRQIHVHYDLLEAAGLKLKGGICKINGEYHLFVDRRKSIADKIDILQDHLDHANFEDIPH